MVTSPAGAAAHDRFVHELSDAAVMAIIRGSDAAAAEDFYSRLGLSFEGTNSEQSLLFGLASSTLLTVLVIPAIYVALRGGSRRETSGNEPMATEMSGKAGLSSA